MAIENQCFEYLKSVNPIAQKIAEDIEKIKDHHKDNWQSLDPKAKDKILDTVLINDSLVQKYEYKENEEFEENFHPLSTFSWFTRSQLNLFSYINVKPDRSKTPLKKSDILSPLKKTKTAPSSKNLETNKIHKSRVSKDEKLAEKTCSKGVAKPKTPPPPPPSKLVPAEQKGLLDECLGQGDDIPKTGFDFLDNW